MSITAIEVPTNTRGTSKRHFTDDELEAAFTLLNVPSPVSDGVLYDKPVGKRDARTVAMYQGWFLRHELATFLYPDDAAEREAYLKTIKSRTWADGDGYRWAVIAK